MAPAQETSASNAAVIGVVSDSSGASIADAEVKIRSGAGSIVTTTTDERGGFHFAGLPPGAYELSISFPGFISVAQKAILIAGQQKSITLMLNPDTLRQSITVTAGRSEGYQVATATSATRLDTPIMDIPQSIQSISKAVLQDRQIVHVADAAEVVSGVTRTIGFSDIADRYTIRGFLVDYTLKDGFKNNNFTTLTDVANVERVEILKGPSGILYGKIEPGGVVNVVTKRPLSDWHFTLQSVFDNFGSARPSIDVTGPLNTSRTLLGRFNGAFDEARSARDFARSETPFAAPALTWTINKNTVLSLEGEYLHLHGVPDAGLPPDSIAFSLPVNRTIGEPTDAYRNENDRGSLVLSHQFGDNWTLTGAFSLLNVNALVGQIRPNPVLPVTGSNANRTWIQFNQHSQDDAGRIDVAGKSKTGPIQHTVLLGFELARDPLSFTQDLRATMPGAVPSLNLLSPVYGLLPASIGLNRHPPNQYFSQRENSGAAYLQDQLTISRQWKLLLGGRYDIARTTRSIRTVLSSSPPNPVPAGPGSAPAAPGPPSGGGVADKNRISHFSPHAGIVFQPAPAASIYFSYSQSFQFLPFNPLLLNLQLPGAPSAPTRGRQYEGGVKLDAFRNRMQATMSYFYLTKDGLPNSMNSGAQTQSQTSKGAELDLTGQLTRGWNLIAAYAYDRTGGSVNFPIMNAPLHSGNVWSIYRVDQGRLHNLSFGAGGNYVDWRQANPLNGPYGIGSNFQLPPYTRLDAMAAYDFRENHWRLQVNLTDLTGRRYYQTDAVFAIVYPAGRIVRVAVKYQF
jgi:iron complex outermembrane receptor protein